MHIVGEAPPVNNAELVRRTDFPNAKFGCLADAHACFKGVKRRYDDDDNGNDIFVYVVQTDYTVRFKTDMRSVASYFPAPDGALLTVQAKPKAALQDCRFDVWGAIVKWEFVKSDAEQKLFPEDFGNRYDEMVWHR